MSYINDALFGKQSNEEITSFLKEEGFRARSGPQGEKGMVYVAYGNYAVWFTITDNNIRLYVEYDCGGHVSDMDYDFEEDNFDSFMDAYKSAIEWSKYYI
ncbi:hypothetical protein ABFV99_14015 [Cytobacillus horneckiae]|uniref:hypothetical protein n=1 Tax=Cytobacillus horneckiae TaxID=549687 RepID=UPI0034CEAEAA